MFQVNPGWDTDPDTEIFRYNQLKYMMYSPVTDNTQKALCECYIHLSDLSRSLFFSIVRDEANPDFGPFNHNFMVNYARLLTGLKYKERKLLINQQLPPYI